MYGGWFPRLLSKVQYQQYQRVVWRIFPSSILDKESCFHFGYVRVHAHFSYITARLFNIYGLLIYPHKNNLSWYSEILSGDKKHQKFPILKKHCKLSTYLPCTFGVALFWAFTTKGMNERPNEWAAVEGKSIVSIYFWPLHSHFTELFQRSVVSWKFDQRQFGNPQKGRLSARECYK